MFAAIALLAFTHFSNRKDRKFIRSLPKRNFQYYLIDCFLLLALPIVICLLLKKFQLSLVLVLGIPVFAFMFSLIGPTLVFKKWRTLSSFDLGFIPVKYVVFRMMIKRFGIYILLILIPAFAFAKFPVVLAIFLIFLIAFLASVIEYFEPKELIFTGEKLDKILFNKWKSLCIPVFVLCMPLFIYNLYCWSDQWYILLLYMLVLIVSVSFLVFYKYYMYQPGRSRFHLGGMGAVFFLCLILPGMFLINLFLSIRFYFAAKKNLIRYY